MTVPRPPKDSLKWPKMAKITPPSLNAVVVIVDVVIVVIVVFVAAVGVVIVVVVVLNADVVVQAPCDGS